MGSSGPKLSLDGAKYKEREIVRVTQREEREEIKREECRDKAQKYPRGLDDYLRKGGIEGH